MGHLYHGYVSYNQRVTSMETYGSPHGNMLINWHKVKKLQKKADVMRKQKTFWLDSRNNICKSVADCKLWHALARLAPWQVACKWSRYIFWDLVRGPWHVSEPVMVVTEYQCGKHPGRQWFWTEGWTLQVIFASHHLLRLQVLPSGKLT